MYQKKIDKKIKILKPKMFFWSKFGRNIKTFISILILIKLFFENKKVLVFSLQSNLFTILLCKIFSNKNNAQGQILFQIIGQITL